MAYPLRHLSIRVPWHDTGWEGRVCAAPRLNGACLKLKRVADSRNDEAEEAVAGKMLAELPQSQWPACAAERMSFMAPFEHVRLVNHPYNHGPETSHGHFAPTPLRHPPYSAAVVPLVEDSAGARILIGVGRVRHIGPLQEYQYSTQDLNGKLRSMLWERMVQHSIRPDFKDGFLLPYHAALAKAADDPDFDPASLLPASLAQGAGKTLSAKSDGLIDSLFGV